jgi:hypothetical protein
LVIRPSKVVGGERASIAYPWNLWDVERIFAQDKAEVPQTGMEWQGQSSVLVHPRIDLEEYVEQRFFEEHTTHQMEEVWYGGSGGGGTSLTRYSIATKG